MQDQDDTNGWALLRLCDALTRTAAEIEDLAADTDTQVGWGPLLDVTQAPAKALGWLGQFVGATLAPNLTTGQQRALIAAAPGRRRGTVQAIADAAKLWLTGTKVVNITERPGGDAYAFTVQIYAAQVIDLGHLNASLQAAKPAGLNMTVTVLPGRTVTQFETDFTGQHVHDVETAYTGQTVTALEREVP
jgi:hypothetical protein